MAYWNHFSDKKYNQIKFSSLNIGDKFRNDFFNGKRRRTNIVCIKLSGTEYQEFKSKKIHKFFNAELAKNTEVYSLMEGD